LRDNFESFVQFVADTLDEGKARGIVRSEVDSRTIAWQFLGIGMTLDVMHLLGLRGEIDRARADMWGRVYLDAVKRKDVKAKHYVSPDARPATATNAIGG
jgi:hypothetical protein